MPEYSNENRGVLFRNDKGDNPNRPDYSGNINVNGEEFRLAAWLKDSKDGRTKFMSLSVSKPDPNYQKQAQPAQHQDVVVTDISDEPINLDDIPFQVCRMYMTTPELTEKLRNKYLRPTDAYAFITQVRAATAYADMQSADAMVMGLWPSRGVNLTGFEVKVSRGDWLHEYNRPAKAETLAKYCDYWYLVVSEDSILKEGELPENWGLLCCDENGKLQEVKKAPKLEPVPIDRMFLASLFRNVTTKHIPLDMHRDAVKAARSNERENAEKNIADLKRAVGRFEEASGLKLDTSDWHVEDMFKLGLAVKTVLVIIKSNHAYVEIGSSRYYFSGETSYEDAELFSGEKVTKVILPYDGWEKSNYGQFDNWKLAEGQLLENYTPKGMHDLADRPRSSLVNLPCSGSRLGIRTLEGRLRP